jgi:ABC-type transport system involved in cytochrome c biogenesis permease subunit
MGGAMLDGITILWFGASYGVALLLEIVRLFRPRPVLRVLITVALAAGVLAHTLFLANKFFIADHKPPLASQFGSLLVLAWILAVFSLYGSLHHPKTAWNLFVLPVVLGLVGLAQAFRVGQDDLIPLDWSQGEGVWGAVHGLLLVLAAVGVFIGFIASLMYLFQAWRLRDKTPPGHGLQLLSLERLEEMNRRAFLLAFPLWTAGILIGLILLAGGPLLRGWDDFKIWGALGLWVLVALLLLLRQARRLGKRQAALLTIVAFVVMMFTLVASHSVVPVQGGTP